MAVICSAVHWLSTLMATSSSLPSATTARSCSAESSASSGCASATRRASSAKSSFSARQMASTRDSGMSPLASMRLTLDSAMPSARARSA